MDRVWVYFGRKRIHKLKRWLDYVYLDREFIFYKGWLDKPNHRLHIMFLERENKWLAATDQTGNWGRKDVNEHT